MKWSLATVVIVCLLALSTGMSCLHGQSNTGTIQGSVVDSSGQAVKGASVAVTIEARVVRTAVTAADGKYSVTGLPAGTYTVQISAPGFATHVQHSVQVAAGVTREVPATLSIASVSEEVTVEAEGDSSIAAQLAPVKSLLDAGSARTEITSNYVAEYTSPVTDFADIIQAAPGTVSFTTNGIGNGQAKIYFRGFVDDDYTMTWDGVPFNDSNDPSHHSWAYIPAAAIGHVDFDRSPGTASDMGTSNFGGTIHFFSPELSDQPHVRIEGTYGSWNTYQILGDINSGAILHGKAHFWLDSDYQSSKGYQTFSPKQDVAATAKFDYKISPRTQLTVIGTNIIVDAFQNNDPTRRQLLHHGDRYLYENTETNSAYASTSKYYYDPQYWRFSVYHVASFFDIVSLNHDFGKNWKLTTKTYSYGYSNHQHYQNKTDQDLVTDSILTAVKNEVVGGTDQPGWVVGTTPTGVDKLNQYARGGEIEDLSYATKWGVFRTGSWYELTNTLRYQIYTDPITWVDSPYLNDIKFHEHFYTTAVQPYAEFQFVAIPDLTLTAGLKDAFFRMSLTQYADGHTIGALPAAEPSTCPTVSTGTLPLAVTGTLASSCTATTQHAQNYNALLPSLEANYRVTPDASLYIQYGRGSIAPFSAVFDYKNAQVAVTPPPTIANTYQGGTVVKLNRLAFDADVYHIHFMNTYSETTDNNVNDADYGNTYAYAQPPSDTNGFEAEGNYAATNNLAFNANGTFGVAKYEASAGSPAVLDSNGSTIQPAIPATTAAWVALAPHDTEALGMTYRQKSGLDFGIFGKRIGSRWNDVSTPSGSAVPTAHQAVPLDPFWMSNLFLNYNVHGHSIFDGSKIKLSINNLFDDHSIVANSAANDGTTLTSTTVNTALEVTQNQQLYSPSWADTIEKQAGRSVMISFQIGLTRHQR
jgi:iron complex outermembrane receptor protein